MTEHANPKRPHLSCALLVALMSHSMTTARAQTFVIGDLEYSTIHAMKDPNTGRLVELGVWKWKTDTGYSVSVFQEGLHRDIGPFALPAISLRSPQSQLTRIEHDGECYFVQAEFDPQKDRLTSFITEEKTGAHWCFYVLTPEGKKIGYRGKPKTLGEALETRVFNIEILQELAQTDLVGKEVDEASRTLRAYGFRSYDATRGNITKYSWREIPELYGSVWVGIDLTIEAGIVRTVTVEGAVNAL